MIDLRALGACDEAVVWYESYDWPDDEAAWCACGRGDWMLWLCAHIGVDRVLRVRSGCAIARTVLHLVPAGEERPRLAIEAAERWCDDPSAANRTAAAYAAAYAADAASSSAADADAASSSAADAAAAAASDASDAADAAADADAADAADAANAAYAAHVAYAAYAAYAANARREHADIVRSTIPWEVVQAAVARRSKP